LFHESPEFIESAVLIGEKEKKTFGEGKEGNVLPSLEGGKGRKRRGAASERRHFNSRGGGQKSPKK